MNIPIVHHIEILYKNLYLVNSKINKQDKLIIHKKILDLILEILGNGIEAGLSDKNNKVIFIKKIRTNIEIVKHLIRIENNLKIINEKFYIKTVQDLEKISMMANGWLKSIL